MHIAQAASDKISNVTGLKYKVSGGSQLYLFPGTKFYRNIFYLLENLYA